MFGVLWLVISGILAGIGAVLKIGQTPQALWIVLAVVAVLNLVAAFAIYRGNILGRRLGIGLIGLELVGVALAALDVGLGLNNLNLGFGQGGLLALILALAVAAFLIGLMLAAIYSINRFEWEDR